MRRFALALALVALAAPPALAAMTQPAAVAGTWTPTLIGATSGAGTTSIAVGTYIHIGPWWTATFNITTTATASIVGAVQIGGLPWTQSAITNDSGTCSVSVWNNITIAANYTHVGGTISTGTAAAFLDQNGSGQAFSLLPAATLAAAVTLQGTCTGHQ